MTRDFRKQIEENKRDLEKERIENEKFAYRVEMTAKDIRERLLAVTTKIEKGTSLNYCGLLVGFNFLIAIFTNASRKMFQLFGQQNLVDIQTNTRF